VFFTPKRRPTAHRLLGRRSRDSREYAMTLRITAWVQVALAVALVGAAVASYQAIQAHAAAAKPTLRLALPGAFGLAALVTVRSALRNFRLSRTERSNAEADR
jgi:hypothetical protein